MRIGMYMAYAPSIRKFSLKQEGLGRYSSILMKALVENGHSVVIACPKYCVAAVKELLEEQNLSENNVKIVSSKKNPIVVEIFEKWKNRTPKKRGSGKIKRIMIKIFQKMMSFVFTEQSIIKLTLASIIGFFCMLILGIAGTVFGILALALAGIFFLFYKTIKWIQKRKHDFKHNFLLRKFVHLYYEIKKVYVKEGQKLMEYVRQDAMEEVLHKISCMEDKPDVWYSPTAFWPEFNKVEGKKILCAPDLVTIEFAEGFSKGRVAFSTENTRTALEGGTYFITYSEYIAKNLLIDKLGKCRKNVKVIPHAMNDMLQYLDIKNTFKLGVYKYDINEYFAKNIIMPGVISNNIGMQYYLSGFAFGDMKYMLYPSQIRDNKNMWTLIRAYEHLLRGGRISAKLILTCDITLEPELFRYIKEKRLQYDVLFFRSVTSQQLAALYMCAQLVVTPTLYEGGFPFTFGEGMSVGTPSLMSDIPQVKEVLLKYGYLDKAENWLFDVYSEKDLSDKLYYALNHIDELKNAQQELFDLLNQRTWRQVGEEYIQVFDEIMKSNTKIA